MLTVGFFFVVQNWQQIGNNRSSIQHQYSPTIATVLATKPV